MNTIPIIILTKDNPEYLYITLKSLTASDTINNPIIIVDDCSSYQLTKSFLYTNDIVEFSFNDWTVEEGDNTQEIADKTAAKTLLNIPEITKTFGIKGKVSIIKTPKYLGKKYRTLYGINLGFTLYPNSKLCCIIEDDLLFNKNWLNKGLEIYNNNCSKTNISLISVYNEHALENEIPEYLMNNRFQGKMFLVTNNFYKSLKEYNYFSSSDLDSCETIYNNLQQISYNLNFNTFTSNKSYIQNLEKRNLCSKDKELKYKNNFQYPIAWNKDF